MDGQFNNKQLAIAFEYWQEIRGMRTAPRREELSLREMSRLLSSFNLIDVLWEPVRFRHRLVGSSYVEMLGRDVTGCFVDEDLYGAAAEEIFNSLKLIADEVRPYRRVARLDWHDRNWLVQESAELPLVDEDGRVNMILRVASFTTTKDLDEPRLSFLPLTQSISI
jgi:hypothetical protein